MQKFKTVDEIVSQLKPERPIYCIRKKSIQVASRTFQNKFSGTILYAVKTNPHPEVLKTIIQSGINNFDVASIKEIAEIKMPDLNASDVEAAMRMVAGTARSMGIIVKE